MIRSFRMPARSSFFLVCAASTAVAQNPPLTEFPSEVGIPWPVELGELGSVTRVVSGDLDGDARPDVFALSRPSDEGTEPSPDARKLVMIQDPWQGAGTLVLPDLVHDIAYLPRVSNAPAGLLAQVGPEGLQVVAWSAGGPSPFVTETVSNVTPWLGAMMIRGADLDNTAGQDFVGLAADRHNVILRRGGASPVTLVFDVGAEVIDLVGLQWIEGGPQEVAALTRVALKVYDNTGTLLDTFTPAASGFAAFAPVRFGENGPDRLAWVTSTAGGLTRTLNLVRHLTPQVEGPTTTPWDDVVAVRAADMDHDGDEDLVMAHGATNEMHVYSNGAAQGLARVYAWGRSQAVTDEILTPSNGIPNESNPIFADLSSDGNADLLKAVQYSDVEAGTVTRFEILRADPLQEFTSEDVFASDYAFDFALGTIEATIDFWIWPFVPQGATHLQVVVFNQSNAQSYLTPTSDSHKLYSLAGGSPVIGPWQVYDVTMSRGGPLANWDECTMPIRWVEVRFVKLDANGNIVTPWPTATVAVLTRGDDYCAIFEQGNEQMTLQPPFDHCPGNATCVTGLGSWQAEAITHRRRTSPPPGIPVSVGPPPPAPLPVIPAAGG